jgi:rhodanese-related sulfurtransferase
LEGQDSGTGEFVNVAPQPREWKTPPGHYGLIAGYADDYLSQGPGNGNYVWSFTNAADVSGFFIVDVRSNTAYCNGHIPGAVNIPFASVAKPWNLDLLPTGQPILVVCATGQMSGQVAAILGTLGYQVRILNGGMNGISGRISLEACPK